MTTETLCRRPFDDSPLNVRWDSNSSIQGDYQTATGKVTVRHGTLIGGKSEGVEVVLVDTGAVRVLMLPTRGMGIWKMWADDVEFGWSSPVDGPVHPSHVPVFEPTGLGWLEGFDELFVRCGLESNGAPEKDDQGFLRYPLHGRVANLPATNLRVIVNEQTDHVEVVADIIESRLFFTRLRLHTRTIFYASMPVVEIVDEVINERSVPATMQMLYHINIGEPVLSEGSTIEIAFDELAPKDDLSASEMSQWHQIGPPQVGYHERVYFFDPKVNESQWSTAMLRNPQLNIGFGIKYDTRTLPYFIVWKNLASKGDGYVVGLEPSTNFPNHRTFEASQDRVVSLAPGESKTFHIHLCPLTSGEEVDHFGSHINERRPINGGKILTSPKAGWTFGVE